VKVEAGSFKLDEFPTAAAQRLSSPPPPAAAAAEGGWGSMPSYSMEWMADQLRAQQSQLRSQSQFSQPHLEEKERTLQSQLRAQQPQQQPQQPQRLSLLSDLNLDQYLGSVVAREQMCVRACVGARAFVVNLCVWVSMGKHEG
jgi:hypothetical protein